MNAIYNNRQAASVAEATVPINIATHNGAVLDPLGWDQPDDEIIVTTRRSICRIALVAAETAGRFERETIPFDPMSWMLSPRALFNGASAIDACLGRSECLRAVLVHGLSLGMDADPTVIDGLTSEDELAPQVDDAGSQGADILPFTRSTEPQLRLFTATVVSHEFGETIQAFHASLAVDEAEVAGRLFCRIGPASADACIISGFDPTDPLVTALVAPAMCDALELAAVDPASPLAAGLDVNIEQRFIN